MHHQSARATPKVIKRQMFGRVGSLCSTSRVRTASSGDRPGILTQFGTVGHVIDYGFRSSFRPRRCGVARSLRTEATRTLGLIIGDILNPFFAVLARAVEDEARVAGRTVVIGNADERAEPARAGAAAVRKPGAQSSFPTLDDL
jgi:hypothetical protein